MNEKLSEYELTSPEDIERNGLRSRRESLFAGVFATSDVEQFSAIFDVRMFSKVVFEVLNLGDANGLKYTVYGAIDPTVKWEPLPDAQDLVLAAEASTVWTLTDAWSFVRVGVVSAVAGDSTTPQVLVGGKSR